MLGNEKQTLNNAVNEIRLLSVNFYLCIPLFCFVLIFFKISFQTFTFVLAWHFPHRYLLNIFIKRENISKRV